MQRSASRRSVALVCLFAVLSAMHAPACSTARGDDPELPVYLGAPQARARIDAFISELSQEGLAESIAKLPSSNDQFYWPGFHSGQKGAQLNFMHVLANRRSVKVLMEIADLPDWQRADECMALFDRYLEIHTSTVRQILGRVTNPDHPQPKNPPTATKLSLCTAMLATAQHSQPDVVRQQLAKVEGFRRELEDFATQHGKSLSPAMLAVIRDYIPDNLFQLHILAIVAERTSNHKALDRVQAETHRLWTKDVPVAAWNAHTTYFDHIGVPMDTSKGSMTFRIYDWKIPQDDLQREFLKSLRGDLFPDR